MKHIKRWLIFFLMMCLLMLSIGFSLWNTQLVPVSFGLISLEPRPLSVWLVVSFSLGALTGLLIGAGLLRHVKLRRRIKQLEDELAKRPAHTKPERD